MSRSLHFLLHMLLHKSLSLRQHAWLTGPGLGHLPCTSLAFSFAFSLLTPSLLSRFPSSCLSLARPRARALSLSLFVYALTVLHIHMFAWCVSGAYS